MCRGHSFVDQISVGDSMWFGFALGNGKNMKRTCKHKQGVWPSLAVTSWILAEDDCKVWAALQRTKWMMSMQNRKVYKCRKLSRVRFSSEICKTSADKERARQRDRTLQTEPGLINNAKANCRPTDGSQPPRAATHKGAQWEEHTRQSRHSDIIGYPHIYNHIYGNRARRQETHVERSIVHNSAIGHLCSKGWKVWKCVEI